MKQKVSHSRLQMVGLFANFSKNFIYMKLENSSQSATGKVALIGSLEGPRRGGRGRFNFLSNRSSGKSHNVYGVML